MSTDYTAFCCYGVKIEERDDVDDGIEINSEAFDDALPPELELVAYGMPNITGDGGYVLALKKLTFKQTLPDVEETVRRIPQLAHADELFLEGVERLAAKLKFAIDGKPGWFFGMSAW